MRDQVSYGSHPLTGTGSALWPWWSTSTLPEFCGRALAKGYAQQQVQDKPCLHPLGGEWGSN